MRVKLLKLLPYISFCVLLANVSTVTAVEQTASAKIKYRDWGLDAKEKKQAGTEAFKKVIEIYKEFFKFFFYMPWQRFPLT